VELVASLSQGRTAVAQCGLFTYKSVPVIFEPPCTFLSEVKSSNPHKLWTEISTSVPHFLKNPITYRCLLKMLYSVRRPVTTLDCVLVKDSIRAFVAVLGP